VILLCVQISVYHMDQPEPMRSTSNDDFATPPADLLDPVIEAYKKDVDRTLLRENLKLTVAERLLKFQTFMESLDSIREAGKRMRTAQRPV
jgi:hypothetical protein